MDSCDSTGYNAIYGGRREFSWAQSAMRFIRAVYAAAF